MATNKFQAGAGQTASSAASSDMLRSTAPRTMGAQASSQPAKATAANAQTRATRHRSIRQRVAFAFGNLG